MLDFILDRAGYWAIIGLMMIGLYITFASQNLIKRLVGVSLFQTSLILFYISLGKVAGGTPPILIGRDAASPPEGAPPVDAPLATATDALAETLNAQGSVPAPLETVYSNPLPHVLMLTAIVVGVATLSVGLSLIVRIREAYGTIEADEVAAIDIDTAIAQEKDDAADAAALKSGVGA